VWNVAGGECFENLRERLNFKTDVEGNSGLKWISSCMDLSLARVIAFLFIVFFGYIHNPQLN